MVPVENGIITEFRDDHRFVRDALLDLASALRNNNAENASRIISELNEAIGPHFRYEEDSLYPEMRQFLGDERVDDMLGAHDLAVDGAKRLLQIVEDGDISPEEAQEGTEITTKMMTHVQDCDGLAVLMEKLTDEQLEEEMNTLSDYREDGVTLLQWAETLR